MSDKQKTPLETLIYEAKKELIGIQKHSAFIWGHEDYPKSDEEKLLTRYITRFEQLLPVEREAFIEFAYDRSAVSYIQNLEQNKETIDKRFTQKYGTDAE